MPMGQVPVLEIDGKAYHQSKAIARFLAKKYKLYGTDDLEALEIDATIDSIDDLRLRECNSGDDKTQSVRERERRKETRRDREKEREKRHNYVIT